MIREEIKNLIEKSIKELQKAKKLLKFDIPKIQIEHPEEKAHGDYATNIALKAAKIVGKTPIEIAEMITNQLLIINKKLKFFKEIKIAKPGFINFFLSKEYLQKQVGEILRKGEKFGQLKIGKGKKVQVEFISANPTGPLTVGNTRGGPFGDVLGNILEKAGFKVEKAYYINDYGMQIFALGHSVLKDEKAQYKGDYIDYLNKKIKEKDPYRVGELAAKIIIDEMIKKTVERMGIKYDEWLSETKIHKLSFVDKILKILKKKNLIYQKEGAIFFKSSKFGDGRDRVLVKKNGWKTYLAGDIALHYYKFEKKKFDKVINIWGADHYGDVPGFLAAMEALGKKDKVDIILLQFVTILERGEKKKMSKRMGVFVTMDELLNQVGPGVIRFFFLQKSAETHLNFDLSLAKIEGEKNPVYYVQYAHARICSILRKAKSYKPKALSYKLLNHPSELALIKQLIRLPEVIEDTTEDYQIQRLPQYALNLATVFHQFYRDCKVLTEDKNLKEARLGLILATKIILKNILNLMGISAPEKM